MRFEKQAKMVENLLHGRMGVVPSKVMASELLVAPILDGILHRLVPRMNVDQFIVRREGEWIVFSFGSKYPDLFLKGEYLQGMRQVYGELTLPRNGHYYEKHGTVIGPEDIVVDCGACEGLFSLFAAPRCARVYAIEPIPDFCVGLQRTFAGVANVEVVPVALSDRKGTLRMRGGGLASCVDAEGDIEVDMATIDSLFYERGLRVSYIKADLEGYEVPMLKGAAECIRSYRPRLAITTYHRPSDARDIIDTILDIDDSYNIRLDGVLADDFNVPIMLHAW